MTAGGEMFPVQRGKRMSENSLERFREESLNIVGGKMAVMSNCLMTTDN
jgi:hypothetical protein